ncbi:MAG: hypothetical protein KKA76_06565, partial [Proteobacteria bacterium]|nr:hypothetical protein [Pseudomonadota bacterium]
RTGLSTIECAIMPPNYLKVRQFVWSVLSNANGQMRWSLRIPLLTSPFYEVFLLHPRYHGCSGYEELGIISV